MRCCTEAHACLRVPWRSLLAHPHVKKKSWPSLLRGKEAWNVTPEPSRWNADWSVCYKEPGLSVLIFFFYPPPPPFSSVGVLCHTSLARSQMWVWHVAVCVLTPTSATTLQFLIVAFCSTLSWCELGWCFELRKSEETYSWKKKKKWPALRKFFLLSPLLFLAMLPIYNSSPSLCLSSFNSQGWPGGFPETKCSCRFF